MEEEVIWAKSNFPNTGGNYCILGFEKYISDNMSIYFGLIIKKNRTLLSKDGEKHSNINT